MHFFRRNNSSQSQAISIYLRYQWSTSPHCRSCCDEDDPCSGGSQHHLLQSCCYHGLCCSHVGYACDNHLHLPERNFAGDQLNLAKIVSGIVLLIGELLVCQPSFLFPSDTPSSKENITIYLLGYGVAFTACFSGSVHAVFVNMMKTEVSEREFAVFKNLDYIFML